MEGTVTISIKDFELLRDTQIEYQKITDILEGTFNNEDREVKLTDDLVSYINAMIF